MKLVAVSICVFVFSGCQPSDNPPHLLPPTTVTPPEPQQPTVAAPSAPPAVPQANLRKGMADRVWKTTLGNMYRTFLLNTESREQLPERARMIAERILSDPDQVAVRMAAMQIMDEDLYVSNAVNEDVIARISLLEDELTRSRKKEKSEAADTILGQIPYVFLLALPSGSPLIRSEAKGYFRQSFRRFFARIRRKELPLPHELQWKRIMSSEAIKDYEIDKTFSTFSKTFAPLSIVEMLEFQKEQDPPSEDVPPDEFMKDF